MKINKKNSLDKLIEKVASYKTGSKEQQLAYDIFESSGKLDMLLKKKREQSNNLREESLGLGDIIISTEVLDCYDGQCDCIKVAKLDDKILGYLQYAIYENQPSIQMIEVAEKYRRNKIATKLLQSLQKDYPDSPINFGMLTDDGKELFNATTKQVKNRVYSRHTNELAKLNKRNEEINNIWNKVHNDEIEMSLEDMEALNSEQQKILLRKRELEDKIELTPKEFTYIKEDNEKKHLKRVIDNRLILDDPNEKPLHYYTYFGPVYDFNHRIVTNRVFLDTKTTSKGLAYNSLKNKYLSSRGLEPYSHIRLDRDLIEDHGELDSLEGDSCTPRIVKHCTQCGAVLTDSGECPYCDLGDSSVLEEDYLQDADIFYTFVRILDSAEVARQFRQIYNNLKDATKTDVDNLLNKYKLGTNEDRKKYANEFNTLVKDILNNPSEHINPIVDTINSSNIGIIINEVLRNPIVDSFKEAGMTTFHKLPENVGAMFLLDNGDFVFTKDYSEDTHLDLIYQLVINLAKAKYPNAKIEASMNFAYSLMDKLLWKGLIRCNTGSSASDNRFYCVLPSINDTKPTNAQYYSLLNYLDLNTIGEVLVFCGRDDKTYDLNTEIPEYVIGRIKRYYSSGILYESIDGNYGYHAGDLGKSERREQQTGGRGTGHLGTGTYFVGNPSKIKGYNDYQYGKGKAPHHIVDFSSYNLYKPSNNTYGYKLHDTLREINNGYKYYTKNANDYDWFISKGITKDNSGDFELKDVPEIVSHLNNLLVYDSIELPKDINWDTIEDEYEQEDDRIYDELKDKFVDEDGHTNYSKLFDAVEDELNKNEKFNLKNKIVREVRQGIERELDDRYINEYKRFKGIEDRLYDALEHRHSKEEIAKALNEVNKHLDDKTGDSLSTIFMKSLGYEGVDVRHLQDDGDTAGLDNTAYGSVIYDVRPETIIECNRLKEDITQETDSEGNPLTPEQVNFFKNSKVRDNQGRLLVCYHGSDADRFDTFDHNFIGDDNKSGYGFYFTLGTKLKLKHNSTYACYINLEKPLTDMKTIGRYICDGEELRGKGFTQKEIIDKLSKKYNCDGIINPDRGVVVFYSNQIKSIDNKNPSNSNNINEDVFTKDGEYNPDQDSRYKRLLKTPINKLTRDDMLYLYTIHFTKFGNGYNANGTQSTYWYLGNYDNDFNKALEYSESRFGEEITKTYEHFSKLNFPLKVYRALRNNEDEVSGKSHSLSWTTDINLYKANNSIFKNCDKIVQATITPDMIQNEWTIVNYVHYSARPSYGRYPESEITLKPRFKNVKLQDLHYINKDEIKEHLGSNVNEDNSPEASEEEILKDVDNKFGQEKVYMWSTYILPNGHFLNPENIDDEDYLSSLTYEHNDFYEYVWGKYGKGESVFDNCMKMNVTWPYIVIPKNRWTNKQQYAFKEIIDHKHNFEPDNADTFDEMGFKNAYNVNEPLIIYTHGNEQKLYDLSIYSAEDIIKEINQFYARGYLDDSDEMYDLSESATKSKLKEEFLNSIDKNILDTIKSNNIPKDYLNGGTKKCSISAGMNLLKAYNDKEKNIKLVLGSGRKGSNTILHVWVEINGNIYETNGDHTKYAIVDSLKIKPSKPLLSQVEKFLNKSSLQEELLEDEDAKVYYFNSPYETKNFLLAQDNLQRILIVENKDIYLVGDAYDTIHQELVRIARDNAVLSPNFRIDDYDDNQVCLLFVPNSYDSFDELGVAIGDDYDYKYVYKDFVVYSRYKDFDKFKLSKVLGGHMKVKVKLVNPNGYTVMDRYRFTESNQPTKTGKAYKVFRVKNGKLYPPMVANSGGKDTPIGVWVDAEEGEFAGNSKTGRPQVKRANNAGVLAYRPGWHLGDIPRAKQFDRLNKETGEYEFPKDFVWAECDYAMDIDYQPEADEQGYMRTKVDDKGNVTIYKSDKYQHSLAGLKKLPTGGYYKYRTNPNPDTVPWVITGQMRVNKLLDDFEVNEILKKNGIEPIHRQGGDKTLKELGLEENLKVTNESINPEYEMSSLDKVGFDVDDLNNLIDKLEREGYNVWTHQDPYRGIGFNLYGDKLTNDNDIFYFFNISLFEDDGLLVMRKTFNPNILTGKQIEERHFKSVPELDKLIHDLIEKYMPNNVILQANEDIKEEYLKNDDNKTVLITPNVSEVANRIKASKDGLRILYDKNIKQYMVCDIDDMIHMDMMSLAIANYYYPPRLNVQRYNMWSYMDDALDDDKLFFLIYTPKGKEKEVYGYELGEDDYDTRYDYDFGSISTRQCNFQQCPLYKALGNPREVIEESLDSSKGNTIRLYTVQDKSVLDTLKQGKVYKADYNKIKYKNYEEQWKYLSKIYGLKDCPIFLADEPSKDIISSSGIEPNENNVMIVLDVPLNEVHKQHYYTWSDFLYFTMDMDDDKRKNIEDAITNDYPVDWSFQDELTEDDDYKEYAKLMVRNDIQLLKQEKCLDNNEAQYVVDHIDPSWLVDESKTESLNEVYPSKGESKKDFISRFMSETKKEYPDVKQRYVVALSYWNRRNKTK